MYITKTECLPLFSFFVSIYFFLHVGIWEVVLYFLKCSCFFLSRLTVYQKYTKFNCLTSCATLFLELIYQLYLTFNVFLKIHLASLSTQVSSAQGHLSFFVGGRRKGVLELQTNLQVWNDFLDQQSTFLERTFSYCFVDFYSSFFFYIMCSTAQNKGSLGVVTALVGVIFIHSSKYCLCKC